MVTKAKADVLDLATIPVADAVIQGGTLDGTPIGNSNPSTGIFTNLTVGNLTVTGTLNTGQQTAYGSAAILNTGNTVINPGTGDLEVATPAELRTGISISYQSSDRGFVVQRSNSGSAMSDTLPSPNLAAGWFAYIINIDTGGLLTINSSNGINGVSSIAIAPYQSAVVFSTGTTYLATIGSLAVSVASLTDGATIAWNVAVSTSATVTLAGNRILANPTSTVNGRSYTLMVKQDATGSRTLSYGANFKWPYGSAPSLSTAANSVDIFTFMCIGGLLYGIAQHNFQ